MLILAPFISKAYASDYFNPALLERVSEAADTPDLKQFEAGGQAEGTYYVEIYVNDVYVDSADVSFTKNPGDDNGRLSPCLTAEMLKRYGIRTEALTREMNSEESCVDLSGIPDASATLDFRAQALRISVPQVALAGPVRGYVSPDKWDDGLTAAIINYSLSSSDNLARNGKGNSGSTQYASLRPGLNLGAWRLRNYSTYLRSSGENGRWESAYTYAQRGITSLKAQMTLGDTSTPGEIFDSVSFRGTQLASDDEMVPESLRGYAPVVRGIARGITRN